MRGSGGGPWGGAASEVGAWGLEGRCPGRGGRIPGGGRGSLCWRESPDHRIQGGVHGLGLQHARGSRSPQESGEGVKTQQGISSRIMLHFFY